MYMMVYSSYIFSQKFGTLRTRDGRVHREENNDGDTNENHLMPEDRILNRMRGV